MHMVSKPRKRAQKCPIPTIALAAFAVFFTQCPSFLSFQHPMEQACGCNNARSLFQIQSIPSDNHVRQTLDPVEPRHLFSVFNDPSRCRHFGSAGVVATRTKKTVR